MSEVVDFSSCHIDPAPLQIMEGTPLSNVSPAHTANIVRTHIMLMIHCHAVPGFPFPFIHHTHSTDP